MRPSISEHVVIRITDVEGINLLPRPKVTRTVMFKGTKNECLEYVNLNCEKPENQNYQNIKVDLVIRKYASQKTTTSQRKGNGSRAPKESAKD